MSVSFLTFLNGIKTLDAKRKLNLSNFRQSSIHKLTVKVFIPKLLFKKPVFFFHRNIKGKIHLFKRLAVGSVFCTDQLKISKMLEGEYLYEMILMKITPRHF